MTQFVMRILTTQYFAQCFAIACAMVAFASSGLAQRPAAEEFLLPKDRGIYVGVDYYPEHWPAADARRDE
jgi:hypothetical protein